MKNIKFRNSNLIKQSYINIKIFANNLLNVSNEILISIKKRKIID